MILRGVLITDFETVEGGQFTRIIDADVTVLGVGVQERTINDRAAFGVFLSLSLNPPDAMEDKQIDLFIVEIPCADDFEDGTEDPDGDLPDEDLDDGLRAKAEAKAAKMAEILINTFAACFNNSKHRPPVVDFGTISMDAIEAQALVDLKGK